MCFTLVIALVVCSLCCSDMHMVVWTAATMLCCNSALLFSHFMAMGNGLVFSNTSQQCLIYNKSLDLLQPMNWRRMSNTSMFRQP